MHIVADVRYLYSIITVWLALYAYHKLEPQWHTWTKFFFVLMLFALIRTALDLLKRSVTSVSILTVQSIVIISSRWVFIYIIARFIVTAVDGLGYRWGIGATQMMLVCVAYFLALCTLFLSIPLSFETVWCDCRSPRCLVCSLRTQKRTSSSSQLDAKSIAAIRLATIASAEP